MVSARLRLSEPAGVIAANATGGLQYGCHTQRECDRLESFHEEGIKISQISGR